MGPEYGITLLGGTTGRHLRLPFIMSIQDEVIRTVGRLKDPLPTAGEKAGESRVPDPEVLPVLQSGQEWAVPRFRQV